MITCHLREIGMVVHCLLRAKWYRKLIHSAEAIGQRNLGAQLNSIMRRCCLCEIDGVRERRSSRLIVAGEIHIRISIAEVKNCLRVEDMRVAKCSLLAIVAQGVNVGWEILRAVAMLIRSIESGKNRIILCKLLINAKSEYVAVYVCSS